MIWGCTKSLVFPWSCSAVSHICQQWLLQRFGFNWETWNKWFYV